MSCSKPSINSKESTWLRCPVCDKLPNRKVYQCKLGHIFCDQCAATLTKCPRFLCKEAVNEAEPIRNTFVERLLGEMVVLCPFSINGCKEKVPRAVLEMHKSGCSFNFEKYGKLVQICTLLGHKSCSWGVNLNNVKASVLHFTTTHGFSLTEVEDFANKDVPAFRLEFSYKPCTEDKIQRWIPNVLNVRNEHCYILTAPFLTNAEEPSVFAWLSMFLPYSDEFNKDAVEFPSKSPVLLKIKVSDKMNGRELWRMSFLQEPVPFQEVSEYLLRGLPKRISAVAMSPFLEVNLDFVAKIKIKRNKPNMGKTGMNNLLEAIDAQQNQTLGEEGEAQVEPSVVGGDSESTEMMPINETPINSLD